jgi:hypothetical protein
MARDGILAEFVLDPEFCFPVQRLILVADRFNKLEQVAIGCSRSFCLPVELGSLFGGNACVLVRAEIGEGLQLVIGRSCLHCEALPADGLLSQSRRWMELQFRWANFGGHGIA